MKPRILESLDPIHPKQFMRNLLVFAIAILKRSEYNPSVVIVKGEKFGSS
jgi:hypothetical protein